MLVMLGMQLLLREYFWFLQENQPHQLCRPQGIAQPTKNSRNQKGRFEFFKEYK